MQYITFENFDEGIERQTIARHIKLVVANCGYWGSEGIVFATNMPVLDSEGDAINWLKEWMEQRDNMCDNDKPVNRFGCAVRYKKRIDKKRYVIEWMVCYEYWH